MILIQGYCDANENHSHLTVNILTGTVTALNENHSYSHLVYGLSW